MLNNCSALFWLNLIKLRKMEELQTELFHPSSQVLQAFEEIPMCSVLEQIKEKHNLEKGKKVSQLIAVLTTASLN